MSLCPVHLGIRHGQMLKYLVEENHYSGISSGTQFQTPLSILAHVYTHTVNATAWHGEEARCYSRPLLCLWFKQLFLKSVLKISVLPPCTFYSITKKNMFSKHETISFLSTVWKPSTYMNWRKLPFSSLCSSGYGERAFCVSNLSK